MLPGKAPEETAREPYANLAPENRARITHILVNQLPEALSLSRLVEERTGYTSQIGRTILLDVLAHLGALACRIDLGPAEQATRLTKVEEHLRRAITEHPDEVVRERLVDIRELWGEYQREAYSYRESGDLRGVPKHEELEALRQRIDDLMESARRLKPDETSWEESVDVSSDLAEAARVAAELADKLEQCVGAAKRITLLRRQEATATVRSKRSTRIAVLGIVVAIVLAAATFFLGKSTAHNPPSVRSPPQTAVHVAK